MLSGIRKSATLLALLAATCLTGPGAFAQECTVKMGAANPYSGPASAWGLARKSGAELVIGLTNEAGGLQMGNRKCKVVLLAYDSLMTPAGGAAAANYFASESVGASIGPTGSPEHTAFKTAVTTKRLKIMHSTPAFANDALGPDFPLVFHDVQNAYAWGEPLAKEGLKRFKFTHVVNIGPNDQAGTDMSKASGSVYRKLGLRVSEEYYQRGTTNFAPLVQRIMNLGADAVEIAPLPPGDLMTMTRQLLAAGFKGVFASLGGAGPSALIQGAGGEQNIKAYFWIEFVPLDDAGPVRMRAEFQRLSKKPAPDNALFYTAAIMTEQILRAISAAGTDSDGEKIAAELRKLTPNSTFLGAGGWRGKSQFGINQELTFAAGMGLIVDGKRLPVQRVDIPAE